MAYFKIPDIQLPAYPFDYHSHFGGILPLTGTAKAGWTCDITVKAPDRGKPGCSRDIHLVIEQGAPLALVSVFGEALGPLPPDLNLGEGQVEIDACGQLKLFSLALRAMQERNPFAALESKADRSQYERGECAAEDLYIASICILDALGYSGHEGQAANDPALYQRLQAVVEQRLRDRKAFGTRDNEILAWIGYFNRKIYSAGKFTPFDDAYFMRSYAIDWLLKERSQDAYLKWMATTFMFLDAQGTAYAQIAMGEDEVAVAGSVAAKLTQAAGDAGKKVDYKLLVHTAAEYISDAKLKEDFKKISALLAPVPAGGANGDPENAWPTQAALGPIVGLDLVGAENKLGGYATFFSLMIGSLAKDLPRTFGAEANKRALRMICHVHCGEGAGVSSDNRSAIGGYMARLRDQPSPEFYRAYAAYTLSCARMARGRREGDVYALAEDAQHRKHKGTHVARLAGKVLAPRLLEEMFEDGSLSFQGMALRRYALTSARTRDLVAYAAKRNMMAISEALAAQGEDKVSVYDALTGPGGLVALRLGHAYYYRSYVGSLYPRVAFDTNLGSNTITGASGLFASANEYRLNRGLRHLDGYADTGLLRRVAEHAMFSGVEALDLVQLSALSRIGRALMVDGQANLGVMMQLDAKGQPVASGAPGWIQTQLARALAGLYGGASPPPDWTTTLFAKLVAALIGGNGSGSAITVTVALRDTLNLFVNWRAYVLGSDAQGVEHTDIQDEFARMVVLLAYGLLPLGASAADAGGPPGKNGAAPEGLCACLAELVCKIAAEYWSTTIASIKSSEDPKPPPPVRTTLQFSGYKAPASVVQVHRASAG